MTGISMSCISSVETFMVETFVFETFMAETFVVEISCMISFEERAIMVEVETIPVVPVPCGIIIICVSGKIGFADRRGGIVSVRRICASIYHRSRSCDINPGCGQAETNMGADKNLGITGSSDETGGYNSGENK
jgi:hypothetical protein